jgi:putative nucleotidyltransferase with HDIG domain
MGVSTTNILRKMKEIISRSFEDNPYVKSGIGLLMVVLVLMMFPHPESLEYGYIVGSVWTDKDLVAPFSFPIYRDLRDYEKDRIDAGRAVYPVFERREDVARAGLDTLRQWFHLLDDATGIRTRLLKSHSHADSISFMKLSSQVPFDLTNSDWSVLQQGRRAGVHPGKSISVEEKLRDEVEVVYRVGIFDRVNVGQPHGQFAVRHGNEEDLSPRDRLYTLDGASNIIITHLESSANTREENDLIRKMLFHLLRPNLLYDEEETNNEIRIAEDDVPRTIGFVQGNERIISKNTLITDELRLKLDSYRRARIERASEFSEWKHWTGITLHIILVIGLYAVYLYLFRKKIFHDNGKLMLIGLLILIETMFAYLSVTLSVSAPIQFLIFVPAASMLLAIIFDSRVAFYGTVTIAFLVGGIRGNDYAFALTSLIAGAMGAYTVRDIRNRTQIFRSLIFIFMGYAIPIIAMAFEQFESFSTIFTSLVFALTNAVCSPVLTLGLLILFERAFKVTTDLRLLELADLNQPLLRRLAEEAPGTFHHSMVIGNLAEAAAEAIKANSILARVGGYYHDVGKMLKPEYFVENQVTSQNRHNRLKPRMSALIIQSHIKEGIELGKENGLPQRVLDFIPQHHGTTRISFFYDKALKQAARRGLKETINEEDFRYPGPKPQSKEAAIIMLADSVEATTRALNEMTTQRLRQTIENLIQQRFVEGQLDECDLTLRDLTEIKEAFYNILLGSHHQRLTYPETQTLAPPETVTASETSEFISPSDDSPASTLQDENNGDENSSRPQNPETDPLISDIPLPDHTADHDVRPADPNPPS